MQEKKPSNSETEIIETPESISVKEAGASGGRSTLERRGTEFYRESSCS